MVSLRSSIVAKPKGERSLVLAPPTRRAIRRSVPLSSSLRKSGSPVGMIALTAALMVLAVGFAIFKSREGDASRAKSPAPVATVKLAAAQKPIVPQPVAPEPIEPEMTPDSFVVETLQPVEPTPAPTPAPAPELVEAPPVEEAPPGLTEEQKASALTFLKSTQVSKRKSAYAGFRKLGASEKSTYLELLTEAQEFHSSRLGDRAYELSIARNAISELRGVYDAWIVARDTAKKMVQTNWKESDPKNYKQKHAEMDAASNETADLYARLIRTAKHAEHFEPTGLQQSADVLAEIRVEIAWCQDREPEFAMSLNDEIARAGGADGYVKALRLVPVALELDAAHQAAEKYNASCNWASGAYQSFASGLNERRVALGLPPLRLDEKLSDACAAHSADMAANGYFSHTGLTPETKSFGNRAKRAGFDGFATGECIFMGTPSPVGAHQAWWYSDGHRLIMYANNPNTLGLGLHGKHWTLNTAKKKGW